MKKRLEAELISIAHRILKLKNKSEVDQLYKETQKLYETLAVLKFYQDNFESVKSDVDAAVLDEKLEEFLDSGAVPPEAAEEVKAAIAEPVAVAEPGPEAMQEEEEENAEETHETIAEATENIEETTTEEPATAAAEEEKPLEEEPAFKPAFELAHEEEEEIAPAETASEVMPENKKVAFENFLGEDYTDPVFVKPNEVSLFSTSVKEEEKPKSPVQNESASKSIAIGLNDRIGFVKHLFGDSNEDFNRVLSQLNTFDSFEEAKNFIDDMIKPDYNNWEGAEDYAERFMDVVEKKFQ